MTGGPCYFPQGPVKRRSMKAENLERFPCPNISAFKKVAPDKFCASGCNARVRKVEALICRGIVSTLRGKRRVNFFRFTFLTRDIFVGGRPAQDKFVSSPRCFPDRQFDRPVMVNSLLSETKSVSKKPREGRNVCRPRRSPLVLSSAGGAAAPNMSLLTELQRPRVTRWAINIPLLTELRRMAF